MSALPVSRRGDELPAPVMRLMALYGADKPALLAFANDFRFRLYISEPAKVTETLDRLESETSAIALLWIPGARSRENHHVETYAKVNGWGLENHLFTCSLVWSALWGISRPVETIPMGAIEHRRPDPTPAQIAYLLKRKLHQ